LPAFNVSAERLTVVALRSIMLIPGVFVLSGFGDDVIDSINMAIDQD
jgi:hypothetical protein